ncbi:MULTISPECIES: hypothetical protein [Paenibacillus]|uniref:Uncharacterized protein n=1 Tax=Paenibacillus vandeheii TaxID=3035917 RepID=A0ABT8JHP6_9BACL|nr:MULTISPECIES: hypothetical protein [Paenibacillus]KGP77794.1 hypothetical protein P364_0131520 [Paenibacillus sp. MAEPY2]KGP79559.1 hypothetical protein P363_0130995 [Paenibacillus sp. MAEPY1]MDN4603977.1 hypothetical protein [Paenibacillus vandeheii]
MGKNFSEQNLETLLSSWDSDYKLKTHDGEIRSIEMTKRYDVSALEKADQFIINISRMYNYLTIGKEGGEITLTINVKPETSDSFLKFCRDLKVEEKAKTRDLVAE